MSAEKQLPDGWEVKRLGDLFEITSSKRVFESEWKKSGVPFYRAREIVKLANDGYVNNELFIDEEMYQKYSEKYGIPRANDIMVTGVGTLGICYVVKEDDKFYFKDGNIIWLKTRNLVDSRYIEFAFKSSLLRKQIEDSVGATVATFTIEKANRTVIPLPPLPEQKRIVAILDEAFQVIDRAKENAEKNLANAREVFDGYLNQIFSNPGKNWEEKKLDEVCVVERGSSPRPIKEYFTTRSDGVNWIKIGDTEEGGKYVYSTAQKITKEGAKQSRYVKEGDFILTNSMSLGRPYIMKTDGYIHDGWFVLRLNPEINTEYFFYLLSSKFVQNQFGQLASGAIVKNISGDLVKKTVVRIPSITQQKKYVENVVALFAKTHHLEFIYQKKLATLDELKKSILQKAFSGEL